MLGNGLSQYTAINEAARRLRAAADVHESGREDEYAELDGSAQCG
jgi:hypothetical protein